MKTSIQILILGIFFTLVITACKKEVDKPADQTSTEDPNPLIGGTTSVFKDTVTIKDGDVTIIFSKTDACYPSNEIFSFTASVPGAPANAK